MVKLFAHRRPAALIGALVLVSCASSQHRFQQEAAAPPAEPAILPALPPGFQPEQIVGRWGFAAYHKEGDRPRTEAAAKAQCDKPYVINRGPTGGVMMHLADDAKASELRLKGAPEARPMWVPRVRRRSSRIARSSPSTAASWCCAGWIRKSRAGTGPGSTCAAARAREPGSGAADGSSRMAPSKPPRLFALPLKLGERGALSKALARRACRSSVCRRFSRAPRCDVARNHHHQLDAVVPI